VAIESELKPFRVAVREDELADLARRLAATRLPNEPTDAGWRFGTSRAFLEKLLRHWRDTYDWRRWEAELNRWPQYVLSVPSEYGKLGVHVLHQPGSNQKALPLLLLHGWPGSVFEFYKIVGPLAQPERFGGEDADSFHIVCPSLPGYGFTTGLERPIAPRAIGDLMVRLMEGLGYRRFSIHAGDWGSVIAPWMGLDHPDRVEALHLTMVGVRPDTSKVPPDAEEADWIARTLKRREAEGGYSHVQGTKPQSLAYGLTDSPSGLAAWIAEKYHGWSVREAEDPPFSLDELITTIMIYWLTNTVASASWLYWAADQDGRLRIEPGRRIEVPTAFAFFANDIYPPPPTRWLDRAFNVVQRHDFAIGGHFAALHVSDALIGDLRQFFRRFRS
jgi:microsomal epoxide hydrolase